MFRDLQLLRQEGFPCVYNRDSHQYALDETQLLSNVTLSEDEALSLSMLARTAPGNHVFPDPEAAAAAALKIEAMLPRAVWERCQRLMEKVSVRYSHASDAQSIADLFSALQLAMTGYRKVKLRYDSYSERRLIDVVAHPYRLVHAAGAWHLVGLHEAVGRVRTFKLERIVRLSTLGDVFRVDPRFDIDEYFGYAWRMNAGEERYHVKIRFLPPLADEVDETIWHKMERKTWQDDGSLLFEVDVDGIEEISRWVLGYGDQAQVLAPPELVEVVAAHARKMISHYDARKAGSPC